VTALSIRSLGTLFLAPAAIWQISGTGLPEINESDGWPSFSSGQEVAVVTGFCPGGFGHETVVATKVTVFVT
jgi:hypothetical protein